MIKRVADKSLPPVASLWVGDSLDWIARLSLSSFAFRGHAVTLYRIGDFADPEINGVRLRDASEVFPNAGHILQQTRPAVLADIFRLHMIRDTGAIWFDTDVLCHRPLRTENGYLIGRESSDWANNAVLGLPANSAALNAMIETFSDPSHVPQWLHAATQKKIAAAPQQQRLFTALQYHPNTLGPRALTHFLNQSGEQRHVLPSSALNPLPWTMSDVVFNPYGGLDGWLDDSTMAVHLYLSRLRKYHRKSRPDPRSYIGRLASEVSFDFGDLRLPKQQRNS